MPLPPLLIKASAGLAVVSTVSLGSIYFGTDLLKSKRTVSELIKDLKKDKRLITSSLVSDPDWKAAGKKYRTDNNSKGVDVGSVNGWSKTDGEITDVNAPQDFIDKCKNKSTQKVLNEKDDLYSQVISYCTRATLVSDLIKENNTSKRILEKTEQSNTIGGRNAWNTYKTDNMVKTQWGDKWNLDNGSSSQNTQDAPETFKTKCDAKVKEKVFELTNSDYLDALKWCTA